jgi:hypothetical protein
MNGWFKFHRELFDKPIWITSTPEQKTILMTILGMANHKENEWEFKGDKYTVQPGQFITSLQSIVEKSGKGISIKNVRTALERFEKYGFLANESTNKNRLITIVNWAFYQGEEDTTGKQDGKQPASNRQATGKQPATNKNDKNNKNEKNEEEEKILSDFDSFWKGYPKKVDKAAGEKAFKKAVKDYDPQVIIQGAIDYAEQCRVKETEKTYIKNPATFLNAKSFLDEFDTTGKPHRAGTKKKSLFEQGEESKRRQTEALENYKPRELTPEEQAEEDELLPF